MAKRNTCGKNILGFGKASMYVIAEDGLQKEPLIHHSKPETDSMLVPGKNVIFSRSKAIDFCWKEIANASEHSNTVRVLDLNGSVHVDVTMKMHINSGKDQFCAPAKSQNKHLRLQSVYLNALGVNDLKQTVHEGGKRASCLTSKRHVSVDGCCTTEGKFAEKKARRENSETLSVFAEKSFLEKERLFDSRCAAEKASGGSTNLNCGGQDDSKNCCHLSNVVTDTNNERTGKCYLKRIFYSKGNNYSKPSNARYLPQIQKRTENQTGITPKGTHSSNSQSTEQNGSNYRRKSDKLLLPLNVNVLKNCEKRNRHFKAIVKLPTVVDKKTGQIHLALGSIAYEQSDYNKWSRRQKRITPGSAKNSSFSFPLITKNSR